MMNEDYGTYQCFATNDQGTSLSKPFKVKESSESWLQINCSNNTVTCTDFGVSIAHMSILII